MKTKQTERKSDESTRLPRAVVGARWLPRAVVGARLLPRAVVGARYVCTLCAKSYSHRSSLQRHLHMRHGRSMTEGDYLVFRDDGGGGAYWAGRAVAAHFLALVCKAYSVPAHILIFKNSLFHYF